MFGIHGIDVVAALNRDAAFVSTDSFPNELAHLVGKPGVFPIDHDLLKAGARADRRATCCGAPGAAMTGSPPSGWTLLAISVTSTWLLAWYTLWSLPLAVVVRDRRLLAATLAVQALFIIHQMAPLLAPVYMSDAATTSESSGSRCDRLPAWLRRAMSSRGAPVAGGWSR